MAVDCAVLRAWLTARSIARDLPTPVADHGGFRVDTNADDEVARWVFPSVTPGLVDLSRAVRAPRHVLKLCGSDRDLRAAIGANWQLQPQSYFMTAHGNRHEWVLATGYSLSLDRRDGVTRATIRTRSGDLAASGYAAETPDAFVYDRIATVPGHRRKGLGTAIMGALRVEKQIEGTSELLVATEAGRALYERLGWRTISPYATAALPAPD